MIVSGFGPLQGLGNLKPEDYKNYLKAVSAQNKRVKSPQLHAVISAKGRAYDKQQLTTIAAQWLATMGYGKQPYLVVFHKDTGNNHVHVVSTRIGKDGKKISSAFENIRAIMNLNKIMGLDEQVTVKNDIEKAFSYSISTKAQLMMILEERGYVLKESGDHLDIIKFGIKLDEIALSRITNHLMPYKPDLHRHTQLKAIMLKYAAQYDTALKQNTSPLPGGFNKLANGYTSELADYLKEKHGLVLIIHAKGDKQPYGYSIIDHPGRTVYKGGDIIPLNALLEIGTPQRGTDNNQPFIPSPGPAEKDINAETINYYSALLKAALYNYPNLAQGLHHQGFTLLNNGNELVLVDQGLDVVIPVNDLLNEADLGYLIQQFTRHNDVNRELQVQFVIPLQGINIAGDIDDEQINGRNRRRKRKARTNTR